MKSIALLTTSIFLLGLTTTNASAERGATVLDQGLDGTTRYFNVVCPSGKRTALSYDFSTKVTCTYPVNSNEEVCKDNWDKDEAAKEACK